MKNFERLGEHYKLFSLEINGIKYYFIGRRGEKGFMLLFDKSEQAVDHFEMLERNYERCSKYWRD